VRVDIQCNQSFEVEFLFLQSILVRILVELESDKLNDQFLHGQDDSTDEQGEQDIGDSRQIVSADRVCWAIVSANNQWLESDPGSEHPCNEFGISTEIPDDIFVFLGRGNDGSDRVSPKVRKNHEYRGGCPEPDPKYSEPDGPPHLMDQLVKGSM
jgi:hypothetical protein